MIPHFPYQYNADGSENPNDTDIHSYGPQHVYSAQVLLNLVDMILERDPDAVIVLQADHGLHGETEQTIAAAFGEDAVLPIWNGVLSAIRVPPAVQSGAEHYALEDPLNMARYSWRAIWSIRLWDKTTTTFNKTNRVDDKKAGRVPSPARFNASKGRQNGRQVAGGPGTRPQYGLGGKSNP